MFDTRLPGPRLRPATGCGVSLQPRFIHAEPIDKPALWNSGGYFCLNHDILPQTSQRLCPCSGAIEQCEFTGGFGRPEDAGLF